MKDEIVLYQPDATIQLEVRLQDETVWLIVDKSVFHCGHSLKDMGQKLSAVLLLGIDPNDILKQVI